MDGLLLHLLGENRDGAGRSFWSCFESIRAELDQHYWIIDSQLWMGPPGGFFDERGRSSVLVSDSRLAKVYAGSDLQLWRPGSISRWAAAFGEEFIDLWAPDEERDPVETAASYGECTYDDEAEFVEAHTSIRLCYTDCCCWEIFARDSELLQKVRNHVSKDSSIKYYKTRSENRKYGFSQVGWPTWPR